MTTALIGTGGLRFGVLKDVIDEIADSLDALFYATDDDRADES